MIDRITLTAITGILSACLILTGCEPQSAPGGPPQNRTPEVAVVTIRPQKVVLTTELPGRTSSYLTAEIRPQVNGLIQSAKASARGFSSSRYLIMIAYLTAGKLDSKVPAVCYATHTR